jgi:hypothetical protein
VRLATNEVVFTGDGTEAHARAQELNDQTDGSERFAVELEVGPDQWGRAMTYGGFGGRRLNTAGEEERTMSESWYLIPVEVPRDPGWGGSQDDVRQLEENLAVIHSANRHQPTVTIEPDGSLILTIAVPGNSPQEAARTAERIAAQQARGAGVSGMEPRAGQPTKLGRDPLIR